MRKQAHHYEVRELKEGFKITPSESNRPPVVFKMNRQGFWFEIKKRETWELDFNSFGYIPLYSYYPLLDTAVNKLYETWHPAKTSNIHKKEVAITKYCKRSTGKCLNKLIHAIWERKRDTLDPRIIELHKKLFSVSKGTGNWDRVNYILKHKREFRYLIDDLLKYPAARMAILHGYGMEEHALLHDWKTAFAYDAKVYTSLNKTLMNFPNGVVFYDALGLGELKLPEPVTTRIRAYAYAMIGRSSAAFRYKSREILANIILKSSDEDIKKAIRYMWHYFPNTYTGDFRKVKGIEHAFTLIFDYPASMIGDWDIMGLCKRSEVYQHDLELQERMREQEYEQRRQKWQEEQKEQQEKWEKEQALIKHSKTALPPIPLPKEDYIGFLDTYGMVVQEGTLMGHCIASYAESAVRGHCYLFHVNYEGEQASVEVSPQGFVSQSYGPKDSINKASEHGRMVLGKWAKKLIANSGKPVIRINENAENLVVYNQELEMQLNYAAIPF